MTDKAPAPCGSDSSTELGVLPAPVATIANDGHPRHIGHVWGIGETRLYGPPRNLYREDQLKAYAAAAVAGERERVRSLLRAEQANAANCLEGKSYRAAHDACGAVLQQI